MAVFIGWGQSNKYYGKSDNISDLIDPRSDVRYYKPSTTSLITADDDLIEYLDSTTGNVNFSGHDVAVCQQYADQTGEEVVLISAAEGGSGFSNNKWSKGDANYNALISYIDGTRTALSGESKTWYVAGVLEAQGEVEEANINAFEQKTQFYRDLRDDVDEINATTPIVSLSPTYFWRNDGDYGHAGIAEIQKHISNIRPYSVHIESPVSWLNNDDIYGNGDTTHYAGTTHRNQIATSVLNGIFSARANAIAGAPRIAPQTIYNLEAINNGGTLEVYGFKTGGGVYLNPWFDLGELSTYEWVVVRADDANRTNEEVLTTITDSGSDHHADYTLSAADNKFYYGILRGGITWGGVEYTSEFVAQTKYEHV